MAPTSRNSAKPTKRGLKQSISNNVELQLDDGDVIRYEPRWILRFCEIISIMSNENEL